MIAAKLRELAGFGAAIAAALALHGLHYAAFGSF